MTSLRLLRAAPNVRLLFCLAAVGCSDPVADPTDSGSSDPGDARADAAELADAGEATDAGESRDAAAPCDASECRATSKLAIGRIRVEYQRNPLGIDVLAPRFDWLLHADARDQIQAAYRILVARDPGTLADDRGDLWDSGKVDSEASTQVVYAGPALASRERAYWKVRVWDEDDMPSAWSDVGTWEMGLLERSDWEADWITKAEATDPPTSGVRWIWFPGGNPASSAPEAVRFFRRSFELPRVPERATVLVSADDEFEMHVNGALVGRGSAWQDLMRFDLTPHLRAGANVMAVRARNEGGPAGLLVSLRAEIDGDADVLVQSDASFRTSDASAEDVRGYEDVGFDDADWVSAQQTVSYGGSPWGHPQTPGVPFLARTTFELPRSVVRARVYATALGIYELWLNGQRVGVDHLTPGFTDYRKRVQVQTYDVTALLQEGTNALGGVVADGWFRGKVGFRGRGDWFGEGPKSLRAQLEVELSDGTRQVVATSEGSDWRVSEGPWSLADLLDGEVYDARREQPGWATGDFDDQDWEEPVRVPDDRQRLLVSSVTPAVQVVREIPAQSVEEVEPGVYVFDLGQNIAGWERLRVRGRAGARLTIRFAEVLNPDGTLYTANLRGARATDVYVLRGGGEEVYEPHFTTHGFRYVELSGDIEMLTDPPSATTVSGLVAHSAMDVTGAFETSSADIDRLQQNILWGQRGNFVSVPTDCPQRDERLGWLGDAQMFVRTAAFNMDVASFFTKWMRDVRDGQTASGAFPEVAPNPAWQVGTPAWGDAGVIVPWQMYLSYGDLRILDENYDAMSRWIGYIRAANPDFLWVRSRGSNYGDWEDDDAVDTNRDMLSTAFYAQSTWIVARVARLLGKTEDARRFEALYESIREAFIDAYVSQDGVVASDTQTAYALAFRFGLLPDDRRARAAEHLVDAVQRYGHLTVGFVGVPHILPALSMAEHDDVAYQLLNRDTFPSWLYEVKMGATTVWERWDAILPDGTVTTDNPAMNSLNHYAFGAVGEWMYETVAGIAPVVEAPGYKHFVIRPRPGGGLEHARGTLDTMYGRISSAWRLEDGRFALDLAVPVNTTAHVALPYAGEVRESGEVITAGPDGRYVLGSGEYHFTASVD